RSEAGWISDPVDLVSAEVLTEREFLAISPFLLITERRSPALSVKGQVRFSTAWTLEDDRVPPMMVQARVSTLRNLTVGVAATLTRNRLGEVVYDPNRDALAAEPEAERLRVPKLYALWRGDNLVAVAGSYRIGFGQRLTFDNTRQYTPNGIYRDDELFRDTELVRECKRSAGELAESPCAGAAGDLYVTPDFRWNDSLLGAAAGLGKIPLPVGHLQVYGFASYQPRSIYQYELYSPEICADPTSEDEQCSAPQVFDSSGERLEPTARFSFHTLPDMFAETTAGGNITYFAGRRAHVGLTGYGSSVTWLTEGIELDFQEWSRRPFGGPFGAIGFDMALGYGIFDLFAEAAYSFDSMPDSDVTAGGGPAALARATATWAKSEVETSLRYYDTTFTNPYARPISAADELDGLRARDELGARVRYRGRHLGRIDVRASADVWQQISQDTLNTLLYLRSDFDASREIRWGAWAQYQQSEGGERIGDSCFSVADAQGELDEPIPCGDRRLRLTGRLRYTPNRRYQFSTQYDHTFRGDSEVDSSDEQDISAWLSATVTPLSDFRARVRVRYRFEDISDNTRLEQSLWSYLDLFYRIRAESRLRLRYDLRVWLDERSSTMDRTPSPEHWLWLDWESRF
ncbi:MAG: hypothetical protein AAGC55_04775, partial [Myxococcota bacterium]